jgi:predicted Zn-dependent peptidase
VYQVSHFKNGLTVATAEMPHMASVSLGLWVGVGGRHEPAALNGVSHFIEHMLFKGTGRRSAKQLSEAIEGIGGYMNAFTGEESTCFYTRARQDRFEDCLDVLMDMFLHSAFAPGEIEKERGVIKEELAMYLDQPHQHVQELLSETLWPGHALGRALEGTVKTIDAMSRAQMVNYQRANYVTATTLVAAAGNVRHPRVVKAVGRFVRELPEGRRPSFEPVNVVQTEPRIRLFAKETAQMQVALGIRACSRHDDRRYALRLLNALLGENMSSRLFQVLREDRGLAYSIHSGLSFYDDVGLVTISAGLDTGTLPQALKLIVRELRRFIERPPSATEMRQARDYLIGQLDLSLEGTENQMMWLGDHLLGYGKIITAAEIKQRLSEVKASQIRQVAREYFRPERMSLAVVSPLKKVNGLGKLLNQCAR